VGFQSFTSDEFYLTKMVSPTAVLTASGSMGISQSVFSGPRPLKYVIVVMVLFFIKRGNRGKSQEVLKVWILDG